MAQIIENVIPIAEEKFGKTSMHFHVFEATLDELQGKRHDKNGKVSTGVRYCPEVMQQSLTLLRDCDEKTYDTFAEILNLPS
jgi:hypothetical protein